MHLQRTKIGLFGGTFDPPHFGHRDVALAVLKSGLVDEIWLLPCWKHAFGKNPSDFTHRAIMCTMMTSQYKHMRVCVDEANIKSTYSIDILNYIGTKYQDKNFRLVVGTDNFDKIDEWEDRDLIEQIAKPIWVTRPGSTNNPKDVVKCHNPLSSSELRERLRSRLSINGHTLDSIIRYAYTNGLYGLRS